MFIWLCIVVKSFSIKPTNALISKFIFFGTQLYTFRAASVPIIRSYLLYKRHWHILCRFDDRLPTWIFSADFRKILKYQISWKSVQWDSSSMRTDRQMDTMKLVVAFRNFANVPNYHESDSPLNLCCYVYTYITCIYVSMYIYIIYII